MLTHTKATLLAALLIPGAAFAQINAGDTLGTTETAIRAALESQGYVIDEIEVEDDEIEVEALLGEQMCEIEISPETGVDLAAHEEDADDDDKEDD